MVVVSYSGKEINAKLVYYGPGLSGKTTNLEYIYQSVPNNNRGKMVSMKTRTERTLFFDFLPIDLGDIGGFKTRFLLYTVPGQVYYNATRKLVLRGVDAIIFVADSGRGKMDENIESLQNLRDNLKEYGLSLDEIPWLIQYNKRDLPDVYTIEELEDALNPGGIPSYEAVATNGTGVFESFRGIAKLLLSKLGSEIKLGSSRDAKPARPQAKPAPSPAPAAGTPPSPAARPTPPPQPTGGPTPGTPYRSASQIMNRETPGAPPPAAPDLETATPLVPAAEPEPPATRPGTPMSPAAPTPPPPPAPPARETPRSVEPPGVGEGEVAAPAKGEWSDEQAAAEEAALAAAIQKRAGQKPPEEPEDMEDFEESPEEKRGFWGRLFGKKKKPEEDYGDLEEYDGDEAGEEPSYEAEPPAPIEEPVAEVPAFPAGSDPEAAPVRPGAGSETRLAEVVIPAQGSGDRSPIVIQREIQVPIALSGEEIQRGAKLRLTLEIQIHASDASGTGESKVA